MTIRLITLDIYSKAGQQGWVLYENDRIQWVDGLCRSQIEQKGVTLEFVNWSTLATREDMAEEEDCQNILNDVSSQQQ